MSNINISIEELNQCINDIQQLLSSNSNEIYLHLEYVLQCFLHIISQSNEYEIKKLILNELITTLQYFKNRGKQICDTLVGLTDQIFEIIMQWIDETIEYFMDGNDNHNNLHFITSKLIHFIHIFTPDVFLTRMDEMFFEKAYNGDNLKDKMSSISIVHATINVNNNIGNHYKKYLIKIIKIIKDICKMQINETVTELLVKSGSVLDTDRQLNHCLKQFENYNEIISILMKLLQDTNQSETILQQILITLNRIAEFDTTNQFISKYSYFMINEMQRIIQLGISSEINILSKICLQSFRNRGLICPHDKANILRYGPVTQIIAVFHFSEYFYCDICGNQYDVEEFIMNEKEANVDKHALCLYFSKLNVKMIRCGNHRNVGSSAQLHGRKKSEKQKKLGRVPGATKLHEILNLKKQKEFEENCKIFNVSKLKNMDKYNSMMYALQGIYIEPMPFSIIYINLAMMKILNKKKGDEMLIVDYTMRQMATYNMDRFSGILPPELDKYPGIRKMWGLELIGIPPARDALGGGGTTTYALVLCENGQKHNFDRCLCIMDRISGTLFNKRLKQMHNISRSDYDEALINPFVKLYGYDSIAGYIGSRWVEETLFLLSKDKEKPSYSTCHNHASARLSYRVKANIAPNTSRRKRSILIITEIEHWRNLMNRNYLSQPYAILEETILCHKRECLLGEKQLPLKDQLITIEPNDIKGMDRYRRYGEDVTESPAVEASYVGYPVDEKDAVAEEKKIDELVQEVNQNMQKYVVRMQCKKCKNFQEYVFSDEKDKILRLICETCGNALITKVSTAHDSYEYLWGVKLPDISEKHETDEDENDSELKLYVIAKTVVKRKLYTDDSGNCYQIVTVYDEEKYNLCTDIIKVDKNKLPTTFDNPFEDEKVATSFARHTNNRMPIWMKINQPMEAGRDGQAAIENSFKISKSIIPRKNEPIPEFFQKRVNFIKNQAPKIYAHIYNPNTIPQRRRNKNKNEKKTDEIEEQVVCEFDSDNENIVVQKGSTWYRGPNTSNHELTIAFKEIADIIKNQFKISQKKLVATLVDYDEGYKTFVNIGWFNSMYYDTAKYTMQTGMVLQSMKQIAQFKELPTKSSSNKSKSKKSKKSKK
eukprot:429389_1